MARLLQMHHMVFRSALHVQVSAHRTCHALESAARHQLEKLNGHPGCLDRHGAGKCCCGLAQHRGRRLALAEKLPLHVDSVLHGQLLQPRQVDLSVLLALEHVGLCQLHDVLALFCPLVCGLRRRDLVLCHWCSLLSASFRCVKTRPAPVCAGTGRIVFRPLDQAVHARQHIRAVDLVDAVELVNLQELLAVHLDHQVGQLQRHGGLHGLALFHLAGVELLHAPDLHHAQALEVVAALLVVDLLRGSQRQVHRGQGREHIHGGAVERVELDFLLHALKLADGGTVQLAVHAHTGNSAGFHVDLRQRHRRGHADHFRAVQIGVILVDLLRDIVVGNHLLFPPLSVQRSRKSVGVKLDDVLDVLRRGERGDVLVERDLAVQQVSGGVLVLVERDLIAGAHAASHKAVAAHVLAVHNGLDQPLVGGAVHFLEVGQDKRVGRPRQEAADAEPAVFRVADAGVGRRVVAPQAEAVHVQPRCHTEAVHGVGLLLIKHHLRAIFEAGGRNGNGLVAGADVGCVVVLCVGVGCQRRRQCAAAVHRVAHLGKGPDCVGVGVAHRLRLLGGLDGGVLGRAGVAAVDVHNAHRAEHAVDALGLGLQGCRHRRVLAETRGQQDAGCHGQLRIDLTHHLKAGLLACGAVHAAHDVRRRHLAGVDLVAGHGQARCFLTRSGGKHHDIQRTVVVPCGGVVRACGQRVGTALDGQPLQQNARFLQHSHAVIHLNGAAGDGDLVLGRVKHIDQHHGRNAHNAEIRADALAEGVAGEVRQIAHRLHGLLIAVHQQRHVDCRRRVFEHIHRGGAYDHLQARRAGNGRDHAGRNLARVYAVFVCHSLSSSLQFGFDLAVQNGLRRSCGLQPLSRLGKVLHVHHQRPGLRVNGDERLQRLRDAAAKHRVLLGNAAHRGAAVNPRHVCFLPLRGRSLGSSLRLRDGRLAHSGIRRQLIASLTHTSSSISVSCVMAGAVQVSEHAPK
nr:MAG TPA: hypothetical protein [Caudoviricetes sp.]